MKNILCLTDFSFAANHAVNYAVWFAREINARLTLLHVILNDISISGSHDPDHHKLNKRLEQAARKLEYCRKMSLKYTEESPHDLACECRIGEGGLNDVVSYYCEHEHYDLIIIGTTGTTGDTLESLMIGSNTLDLFKHQKVPVLSVPKLYMHKQIKHLVIATDLQPGDENIIEKVIELASQFQAHVHLTHVKENMVENSNELNMTSFRFVDHYDHLHVNTLINEDPDTAILSFAEEIEADLIVLAGKEHGLLHRLFSQSTTELLTWRTSIPLLLYPTDWKNS